MLNPKDARLKVNDRSKDIKKNQRQKDDPTKPEEKISLLNNVSIKELEKQKVGLFFAHNT
jgi:hypothetical protein